MTNTALDNVLIIKSAENAIRELSNKEIHGNVVRVLKWKPDFENKLPEKSNVFLKNIPNSYDQQKLNDVFLQFGPILSCKVSLKLQLSLKVKLSSSYGNLFLYEKLHQ